MDASGLLERDPAAAKRASRRGRRGGIPDHEPRLSAARGCGYGYYGGGYNGIGGIGLGGILIIVLVVLLLTGRL